VLEEVSPATVAASPASAAGAASPLSN
jgi:hypothetical protein